jgi:HK97 family phage major capsid protein
MSQIVNNLKQKLDRLSTQINDLFTLLDSEGRVWTSAEREKYGRMNEEYEALEEQYKAAVKHETLCAAGLPAALAAAAAGTGPIAITDLQVEELRNNGMFHLSPAAKRARENANNPHAKAFSSRLRHAQNLEKMDPDSATVLNQIMAGLGESLGISNAMSTTVGSQGGDIIPQGFSNQLEEAKKWFGGIDGTVERFPTGTGNTMPWPTVNDTTNKGVILNENVQVAEQDLVFNTVSFSAYILSSQLILIPLALTQDSYFDLDALVAKLLGIRLGRGYNYYCTVGTGSNEPTGIVTATVTAGNVLTLSTGNTATIAYANLVALQHSVDPAYRENPSSKWMFSDTVLKLLKLLVDGNNRPLWQPGLTASFQGGASVVGGKPKILENEYVVNQDMAIPAANAYTVLFGDMSTFKVREVAGGTTVLVLRERYADYLQNGYTAFQRLDSNLVDAGTHPIAVLQQSAT